MTNHLLHVELNGRVVSSFCVIQMHEKENVSPDVVFYVYMMFKTLHQSKLGLVKFNMHNNINENKASL